MSQIRKNAVLKRGRHKQSFQFLGTYCIWNCHINVFICFLHQCFMVLIFNFLKHHNHFINFKSLSITVTKTNTSMASWHPTKQFPFNAHCHCVVKDSTIYPKCKSTSPCWPNVGCFSKIYFMHNHRHLENHRRQHVLPKQTPTLIILLQLWMFVSQSVIKKLTFLLLTKMIWLLMNPQILTNNQMSYQWALLWVQTPQDIELCQCDTLSLSINHGMGIRSFTVRICISTQTIYLQSTHPILEIMA